MGQLLRSFMSLEMALAVVFFSGVISRARGSEFQVIHNFVGGTDGSLPRAGLIVGKGGLLYGTTQYGGGVGEIGTVFSLTPPLTKGGDWTKSVLFSFNGTGGAYPSAGLAITRHGVLFGTAAVAGPENGGDVFSLSPPTVAGGPWTETTLYGFQVAGQGYSPRSNVVFGLGGALFGTTTTDASVYELTPPASLDGSWTPHVLHTFGAYSGDGIQPGEGLVIGEGGTIYGTTTYGGTASDGTVYSFTPPAQSGGPWTESILHSFTGGDDGEFPTSIPTLGSDGVMYGTTFYGGMSDSGYACGTVFSLTPPALPGDSWTESVLYRFAGTADGCNPGGGVVMGADGVLYGATGSGGASDFGTLYSLTPPAVPGGVWTHSVLHSFTLTDGVNPETSLIFGADDVLYGTAIFGGTGACGNGCGTVFALKP